MNVTLIGSDGNLHHSLGVKTRLPGLPARDFELPEDARIKIDEYFPHNDQVLTVAFEVRNNEESSKYGELEGSATLTNEATADRTLGNLHLTIIASNMDAAYLLLESAHKKLGFENEQLASESSEDQQLLQEATEILKDIAGRLIRGEVAEVEVKLQKRLVSELEGLFDFVEDESSSGLFGRKAALKAIQHRVAELLGSAIDAHERAETAALSSQSNCITLQDIAAMFLEALKARKSLALEDLPLLDKATPFDSGALTELHTLTSSLYPLLDDFERSSTPEWREEIRQTAAKIYVLANTPDEDSGKNEEGMHTERWQDSDEGLAGYERLEDERRQKSTYGIETGPIASSIEPGPILGTRGRPVAEDGSTDHDRTISPSPLKFDGDGSVL